MSIIELRDRDEVRTFLLQGLTLQRVVSPTVEVIVDGLRWASAIASNGQPLLPLGVIADVGHFLTGQHLGATGPSKHEAENWPQTLIRSYEDYFLSKIYSDWNLERASDVVLGLDDEDQAKAIAYVVQQLRSSANLGGVTFSPAIVRDLLKLSPGDLKQAATKAITDEPLLPIFETLYDELIRAGRRMVEVIADEDVAALQQRTAFGDMGQYVAHRQIIQLEAKFSARLPHRPVRPLAGRREVPTRVVDEDQYPVGGYSSLSNRGSIESLLHSQLAYMEPSREPGDLFDLKFVRDELFYYSRDENQFLRRRRAFFFILQPDLTQTRYKDAELPAQRIILTLALILVVIHRLAEWLSTDALHFEIVLLSDEKEEALPHERELLEIVLQEMIDRSEVFITKSEEFSSVIKQCEDLAHTSQVHGLCVGTSARELDVESWVPTQLIVDRATPTLLGVNNVDYSSDDDGFEAWITTATRLLELWI